MQLKKLNPGEEVNLFISRRGERHWIAVERLFTRCHTANHQLTECLLDPSYAALIRKDANIAVLQSMTSRDILKPLLWVRDLTDIIDASAVPRQGRANIVDGKQRYLWAVLHKRKQLAGYIVEPVLWKQYVVQGYEPHV